MTSPRSVRFDVEVLHRLDRYVRNHPGTSISSVANLLVDEALRSEDHPGIVFRAGATGRRAGLAAGPDVWEVIATLHVVAGEDPDLAGDDLAQATAEASRRARCAPPSATTPPTAPRSTSASPRTRRPPRRPRPPGAERDLLRGRAS